jgi:hypothetical protein
MNIQNFKKLANKNIDFDFRDATNYKYNFNGTKIDFTLKYD